MKEKPRSKNSNFLNKENINYFFNSNNKRIPIWLIVIYALMFLFMNLAVIESYIGILALLASIRQWDFGETRLNLSELT